MEQYIDEYLRDIFGETLLEDSGESSRIKKGIEKAGKFSKKHPLAVGAMALGAGALAYHRYLSAAARACAQFSGTKKSQCMEKYRSGGMRAEVLSLKENCIICLESPDRELCLEIVKLRIKELRQEIKN
jgi:hypothetical protein